MQFITIYDYAGRGLISNNASIRMIISFILVLVSKCYFSFDSTVVADTSIAQ